MDKKTRTSVYVMVVNEVLDDWEDAKIMGKSYQALKKVVQVIYNLALGDPCKN